MPEANSRQSDPIGVHNMNEEIQKIQARLIANPNRADIVASVDAQMQMFRKSPKHYIIPNVYKWATPLVEEYAYDLGGWLAFVRGIVDAFPKRSEERRPIQAEYRGVLSRRDREITRAREQMALGEYVRQHGKFESPAQTQAYKNDLIKWWTLNRKIEALIARANSPEGKLTKDEQAEVYEEFWDKVEASIKEHAPTIDEIAQLRAAAAARLDLIRSRKK